MSSDDPVRIPTASSRMPPPGDDGRAVASEPAGLLAAIAAMRARAAGARVIVGIAGAPGSGKTTLASALVEGIGPESVAVPLDGFHLSNAALLDLGRRERKGAIDTFDAGGWTALIERIRSDPPHPVWAPAFERAVDEPVAGSIAVRAEHRVVIVEGNYLLVDEAPWNATAALLDAHWFCETPDDIREARLVARHRLGGMDPDAALAWARDVDGANAALIRPTAARADAIVSGVATPPQ